MKPRRIVLGDNLVKLAFDEAPDTTEDENESERKLREEDEDRAAAFRAGLDAFTSTLKAAQDKRKAKDSGPDHREDFASSADKARDAALATDSRRYVDFDALFGIRRRG